MPFLALQYVSTSCLYSMSSDSLIFTEQEAIQPPKGIRDDTTCIVVDILPQEKPAAPAPPPKRPGKKMFKAMFRKKNTESSSCVDKEYMEPDVVEELYEEGSAMLSERFVLMSILCCNMKFVTSMVRSSIF